MLKLVIVEDEDIIRRGLIETIDWQEMGAEVRGSAADGEEALAVISKVSPDVVLTDVRMPVMDGLTATSAIRSSDREDAKHIPIIALSGDVQLEGEKQSMQAGMNAYLCKPVEPELLYKTLEEWICNKR